MYLYFLILKSFKSGQTDRTYPKSELLLTAFQGATAELMYDDYFQSCNSFHYLARNKNK